MISSIAKAKFRIGASRRGFALLYGAIAITALVALASLAVDYGRVQLVKTELHQVADAAALYAAGAVAQNESAVRERAKDVASANKADGSPVILSNADIRVGSWNSNTRVFSPTAIDAADAVEITAVREVPLVLAALAGRSTFTVRAQAVAVAPTVDVNGFVGLDGIDFKNNAYIGSYKSSVTTKPTPAKSTGRGTLSSNMAISFKNNGSIDGDLLLGPDGSVDSKGKLIVSGGTKTRTTPIDAPASPTWSPATNPNGVPQNCTINSNTTLPGGTYYFTNLTLNEKLTFSGPATIYLNGDLRTDNSIVTHGSLPSNLQVYVLGNNRTLEFKNNMTLIANVHAPGGNLIAKNNLNLRGTGCYKSIDCQNNAEFFFDEDGAGSTRSMLVK